MAKDNKKRKRKPRKNTAKGRTHIGRPPELNIHDLTKRFADMKQFLENYWGRVGLGLRGARNSEDVRAVLNSVPRVESSIPFRGHAICLIKGSAIRVTGSELRQTRRELKKAELKAERLCSEYNAASQNAQQALDAVKGTFDGFTSALHCSPLFFFVAYVLAEALRLKELTTLSHNLELASLEARRAKDSIKNTLRAQETWFARNEVVKFARNRRYDKTLINFARAMAGLPEWGWFHSRRSCEAIRGQSPPATPFLLFELIDAITRKTKPLTMANVEKKLRKELLQPDVDVFLKGYILPNWSYLQAAIQFCRGKDFKRADVPFRIMDKFLYHLERPKTIAEIELAKQNQLH